MDTGQSNDTPAAAARPAAAPVLGYDTPARPAGVSRETLGAAALTCGGLFFVALCVTTVGAPGLHAPSTLLVFVLPVAAVGLGVAAKRRPAASPQARQVATASIAVWLGSIQLVLLAAALLLTPTLSRPREAGNRVKCASNLRQIGLAIRMYANDNQGQLPPDLKTVLATQDLTSEVFVCPSSADERAAGPTTRAMLQSFGTPGTCSYILASPLPAGAAALTRHHVLAYEPPENHAGTDGGDGMNVLFGDGRVEWVKRRNADYITAELKAGSNPPRK